MPLAPEWFLKELAAFDPDLRLRWSPRSQVWALERQVRRSLHPGTSKGDTWDDDYIRARDGYILVATIPPHGLHRYIFQKLRDSDLWSQGGWQAVADRLDEMEEEAEKASWAAFERESGAMWRDAYNIISMREGRTVFNPGVPL